MDKLSVVILNWNGINFLKKFLPSLIQHTMAPGISLVVADNNSSDQSVEFLVSNYPNIRLIQLDENFGYAGGYNKALEQIESEYFVLLNSDVEVTKNWYQPVLEFMDQHPQVAAAMPKILSYDHTSHFEYAGAAGGYIDRFGFPFCRGRILSNIEEDHGQYDAPIEIFWASGACMFVRSAAYHEAGGLDADFFAHMEEIDLCWRLKRLGYSVFALPVSKVYHVGGGTLPNNNPRKLYFNYRNSLYLLQKNLPRRKLIPILIMRMMLDGASSLVYLSKFSFSFFWAVFRAHVRFYLSAYSNHKKRVAFDKKEKVSGVGQIFQGSMVFTFIVRKKHTFGYYQQNL
ncbi:MAG: glycosyltransferase family 2 protein [Bacteroidota bacterium]|nr:MAG: glycosyltransferase family 2 protein [Bacteroidota bacterium]